MLQESAFVAPEAKEFFHLGMSPAQSLIHHLLDKIAPRLAVPVKRKLSCVPRCVPRCVIVLRLRDVYFLLTTLAPVGNASMVRTPLIDVKVKYKSIMRERAAARLASLREEFADLSSEPSRHFGSSLLGILDGSNDTAADTALDNIFNSDDDTLNAVANGPRAALCVDYSTNCCTGSTRRLSPGKLAARAKENRARQFGRCHGHRSTRSHKH
ncbi:hypothetical protein BCR34DRAFT_636631 [Clohesyomyces aquaticus]|uniref:Uncharacterized protein n=1 Tax=Clohesyomyces aquaticus TaxID=1231657 RepID=A0A1Y1YVD6_9PLEO|nr:hypothetical protein BCR34DRAFT_636631 [Clohesyomyces aquaticus]